MSQKSISCYPPLDSYPNSRCVFSLQEAAFALSNISPKQIKEREENHSLLVIGVHPVICLFSAHPPFKDLISSRICMDAFLHLKLSDHVLSIIKIGSGFYVGLHFKFHFCGYRKNQISTLLMYLRFRARGKKSQGIVLKHYSTIYISLGGKCEKKDLFVFVV